MPRLRLTLAYAGTNYKGWQRQLQGEVELPTVQGVVEKEISRICDTKISLQGSGRTDTGVHADCQVAHCDIPENKTRLNWKLALNTALPHDIRIKEYAIVADTFHALYDVEKKPIRIACGLTEISFPPNYIPIHGLAENLI